MSDENRKEREFARFGGDDRNSPASRARNRTVLLTPETVGQVRSAVVDDEDSPSADPISELLPPMTSWDYQDSHSRSKPAHEEPTIEEPPRGFDRKPAPKFGGQQPQRAASPQPVIAAPYTPPQPMQPPAPAAPAPRMQRPSFNEEPPRAAPPPPVQHKVQPQKAPARSKVVGFLVSFDTDSNGEVYEIRAGRWLLTSRPTDHSEYILVEDDSISPLHAIVRATNDGKVQVLDQLSEFGTGVFRAGSDEEETVNSMINVSHGDVVRFGKRHFVMCLVPDKVKPASK